MAAGGERRRHRVRGLRLGGRARRAHLGLVEADDAQRAAALAHLEVGLRETGDRLAVAPDLDRHLDEDDGGLLTEGGGRLLRDRGSGGCGEEPSDGERREAAGETSAVGAIRAMRSRARSRTRGGGGAGHDRLLAGCATGESVPRAAILRCTRLGSQHERASTSPQRRLGAMIGRPRRSLGSRRPRA